MNFQIHALEADQFSHLFGLDEATLSSHGVERLHADQPSGFPCRISLQEAGVGESVLLLNYCHQPAATPYRASHAIFVRESADQAVLTVNEVPDTIRNRLLSIRAFSVDGRLLDADVSRGSGLESVVQRLFQGTACEQIHLHNARMGCYLARVTKAALF